MTFSHDDQITDETIFDRVQRASETGSEDEDDTDERTGLNAGMSSGVVSGVGVMEWRERAEHGDELW